MNIALNEETPQPHLLPLHCRCTGLRLLQPWVMQRNRMECWSFPRAQFRVQRCWAGVERGPQMAAQPSPGSGDARSHGRVVSVPCSWWILSLLMNPTTEGFAPSPRTSFPSFFPLQRVFVLGKFESFCDSTSCSLSCPRAVGKG